MSVEFIENKERCPQPFVNVVIPANLSHTGKELRANKPIDRCLKDLIVALVKGGVKTSGCCCGHNKTAGVIALTDGRILNISYPENWHKDHNCPIKNKK